MLKPNSNKTKIILSIITIGIMIFSFSALAMWQVPGIPDGIVDRDLDEVVLNITNWLLGFAGILALLFIVIGGIQYTTAAGNNDQMENAKKTVKWGIIGLVICGLSFAIISVVVGNWLKGPPPPPENPCAVLSGDELNTKEECEWAGCEWFNNTGGCCATCFQNSGLLDCGHIYTGPYLCSIKSNGSKYGGSFCQCSDCDCSWCCCK